MRPDLITRILVVMLGVAAALVTAPDAHAKATAKKGAGVEAGLVRCADVNQPAALSTCGTDPLTMGMGNINKWGDVGIVVMGAQVNAAYQVVYRSFNGVSELPLGTLDTDAAGHGHFEKKGAFAAGDRGAGTLVLRRESLDQFMTGFKHTESEYGGLEAGLVRCAEVNQSAVLSTCGTDPLAEGKAEIGHEGGEVELKLYGASPMVTYELYFRSVDGLLELLLGTLTTTDGGNGKLELEGVFGEDAVGAGNLVLKRQGDTFDQFITGFWVIQKEKLKSDKSDETKFRASLVRCVEVNLPGALATCGLDALSKGWAELNEKGDVRVKVVGAEPLTAYDVVFRGLDGAETAIGTLTTNEAGNANLELKKFFALGTVAAGNFVLERGGFDEFTTGAKVTK